MIGSMVLLIDVVLLFGIKDVKPRRPPPRRPLSNEEASIVKKEGKFLKRTAL